MKSHIRISIVAFVFGVEEFDQLINQFIIVILKVASLIEELPVIHSKDWLYTDIFFVTLVDCRLFDLRENKHLLICKRLLSSWEAQCPCFDQSYPLKLW